LACGGSSAQADGGVIASPCVARGPDRISSSPSGAAPSSSLAGVMQSPIRKRSIAVSGHKTSISLEDAFFGALKDISRQRGSSLSEIITEVERTRTVGNLSSALRLFVLDFYRSRARSAALHPSDADRERLGQTSHSRA
jgi:predicted DNA-binding ribbon-helix-helix protein